METVAELPQWADEQIDLDLTVLALQIEVLLPLHVHGLWHGLVVKPFQSGGDGFHALEIAEHIGANEEIEIVGGPWHGQLREQRSLASLIEPHAFEVKTEA